MLMRRRSALATLAVFASGLPASAEEARELAPDTPRVVLPAGRSIVPVTLPRKSFATIAVLGPPSSLLGMDLTGSRVARRARRRPLDEDGLLPRTVSLRTEDETESMQLVVEVSDPVELRLVWANVDEDREPTFKGLKDGTESPRPLVGFPAPRSDKDGYFLASPARYVFARIDVVRSMMTAFQAVMKRFKLPDPIGISDATQWNGRRPRGDIGQVRHISHDGGCDVDIAIPALDGIPSTVRDHCKGVRLETDRYGCSPGTAKGVDFERLAYFLGTLADEAPGRIIKVFLDDVYRREVIRVAPSLQERKWIKEAGAVALAEDGVLVASPWHTDHVHVRFGGEKARALL